MLSKAIKWAAMPKKSTRAKPQALLTRASFFNADEKCEKSRLPKRQYELGQSDSRNAINRAAVDAARGGQKATTTQGTI